MNNRVYALMTLIALGIWVLVLQNAGVIPPITSVQAQGPVSVRVVEVEYPVDVNLHSVVGRTLVESQQGMSIGVSSTSNTIIPIHWGEVSVSP